MTMQSLIVLHLNVREREIGKGTDRDELVDWYLEQKEGGDARCEAVGLPEYVDS